MQRRCDARVGFVEFNDAILLPQYGSHAVAASFSVQVRFKEEHEAGPLVGS